MNHSAYLFPPEREQFLKREVVRKVVCDVPLVVPVVGLIVVVHVVGLEAGGEVGVGRAVGQGHVGNLTDPWLVGANQDKVLWKERQGTGHIQCGNQTKLTN